MYARFFNSNILWYFRLDSSSASWMERSERDNDHNIGIGTSSYIYADCQSSFHGIFVGLLLAIMTIVFVILMFVGFENRFAASHSHVFLNQCFKSQTGIVKVLIFSLQNIFGDKHYDQQHFRVFGVGYFNIFNNICLYANN